MEEWKSLSSSFNTSLWLFLLVLECLKLIQTTPNKSLLSCVNLFLLENNKTLHFL